MIAVVLGFAAACFLILAPWQFGRNAERSTQNDAVQAAVSAAAVPVTDLMSTTAEPPADAIWRPVTATGVYEPDRQVYVRLRQDSGGNPVSEVIAPLLLADGTRLLVDRGYVSFSDVQEGVPLPALPTGTVTVTGRVQVDQTDPANRTAVRVDDRIEVYAINAAAVPAVGAGAGAGDAGDADTFYRGYVQLTAQSPGALAEIGLPQVDAGPFLSYALQWCAFGVIALIGLAVFIFREATGGRPEDDHDWFGRDESTAGQGSDGQGWNAAPTHGAAAGSAARPEAAGSDSENPSVPAAGSRRRRSRDGFDRSQLYDD
jgi:cytochrome oxidase assembly protein ShyY1